MSTRGLSALMVVAPLLACAPVIPDHPSLMMPISAGKALTIYTTEETWCRRAASAYLRNAPWTRWAISRSNQEQAVLVTEDIALGLIFGAVAGRAAPGLAAAAVYGSITGDAAAGRLRELETRLQVTFDAYYVHCMAYYGNGPVLPLRYRPFWSVH